MADSKQVAVLVERRYLTQAQPAGLVEALEAAGHGVDVVVADEAGSRGAWIERADVVVARGRSPRLLSLLAAAEARGVTTVNRASAVAAVLDKGRMADALVAAGIPTPRTRVVSGAEPFSALGAKVGLPLILKPVRGDNARGLRVVRTAGELDSLDWPEPVALAQPYLSSDGYDLKLYGIGGDVFAVRARSPLHRSPSEPADVHAVPVTEALASIARRCARLFGLELYGVDCLPTLSGTVVIEVNDYPNYTGVPGASERIARHLINLEEAAA